MSIQDFIKSAEKRLAKKDEVAEVDIEDHYVKYAKKKKCKALKLILLNKRGFPDRTTLCPNARILFIEFKRKDKPLQPPQKIVRKLLISFGFEYHICDEVGQAEKHLDRFLENDDNKVT